MPKLPPRQLKTDISLDWGTLIHFVFGLLAILLSYEYLFSAIFCLKQLIDYHARENYGETSGDIVEFASGLVVGGLISLAFL